MTGLAGEGSEAKAGISPVVGSSPSGAFLFPLGFVRDSGRIVEDFPFPPKVGPKVGPQGYPEPGFGKVTFSGTTGGGLPDDDD